MSLLTELDSRIKNAIFYTKYIKGIAVRNSLNALHHRGKLMTKIKLKRTKVSLERWKTVYDSPFKKIFLKQAKLKNMIFVYSQHRGVKSESLETQRMAKVAYWELSYLVLRFPIAEARQRTLGGDWELNCQSKHCHLARIILNDDIKEDSQTEFFVTVSRSKCCARIRKK